MTASSKIRHFDLDWVRVLGVLLLVPFHVALIFIVDPEYIMYIKDVVNSIQLKVPVAVKYPLTVLLASGLTLAAYELLVRRFNIMRYLLGMKLKKRDVPVSLDAKLEGQRF
jgi:hypothetical protein